MRKLTEPVFLAFPWTFGWVFLLVFCPDHLLKGSVDFKVSASPLHHFLLMVRVHGSGSLSFLKQQMSHLMTKPAIWPVRPAKSQISLGIHPVWSVFAVCSKASQGPQGFFMRTAKTDQTGRMPRLIWVFTGRTDHFGCTDHFVGFVMRQIRLTLQGYCTDIREYRPELGYQRMRAITLLLYSYKYFVPFAEACNFEKWVFIA